MEYFFVYILKCRDGSYYVGHTDDLEKRIAEHNHKVYGGYTATRLPLELVFAEMYPTRDEAFDAEQKIKKWTREKKEALMRKDWQAVVALSKKKFS